MKLHDRMKSQKGQGIVEYVLVTALVALASIAIVKTFRSDLQTAYKKVGDAIVQGVDQELSAEAEP